jgi:hypothetical protein
LAQDRVDGDATPGASFGEGLTSPRWIASALLLGAGLVAFGAALGGGLGLALGPPWAGGIAACIVSVIGILASVRRLGAGGFGLGLVGGVAALVASTDLRHAVVVARVQISPLPSLAAWEPGKGIDAMQVPPLVSSDRHGWTETYRFRTSRVDTRAVPWLENGKVVGFACERPGPGGRFALAQVAWDGELPKLCEAAIANSERAARRDGLAIEPNAGKRVVKVFASEAELRASRDVSRAFVTSGLLLLGYVLVAAWARRRASREPPSRPADRNP